MTREKPAYLHINVIGHWLHSRLYNRDRSLWGIFPRAISKTIAPQERISPAEPSAAIEAQEQAAAKLTRSASFDRSEIREIKRTSAEEGNRAGDRDPALRVLLAILWRR
jgi:hypothetical protein